VRAGSGAIRLYARGRRKARLPTDANGAANGSKAHRRVRRCRSPEVKRLGGWVVQGMTALGKCPQIGEGRSPA
jgi:hypothetical protein